MMVAAFTLFVVLGALAFVLASRYFVIGFGRGFCSFEDEDLINRFAMGVIFGFIWWPVERSNGGFGIERF